MFTNASIASWTRELRTVPCPSSSATDYPPSPPSALRSAPGRQCSLSPHSSAEPSALDVPQRPCLSRDSYHRPDAPPPSNPAHHYYHPVIVTHLALPPSFDIAVHIFPAISTGSSISTPPASPATKPQLPPTRPPPPVRQGPLPRVIQRLSPAPFTLVCRLLAPEAALLLTHSLNFTAGDLPASDPPTQPPLPPSPPSGPPPFGRQ